ncbi:MAG: IS110 family transposase [Candidatus Zixiibacteriota bacterium]
MAVTPLPVLHPHAAGIDIGSESIFVSVDGVRVERFTTFTDSLRAAIAHLQLHGCITVAMEATGVYWVALHELLEEAGIIVCLVNGAHARNLPGRKSDVQDCQWLQQLHAYGLLRPSFIPPETIRRLRTYTRLRDDHIKQAAMHILHMQKSLDLMNLKIHLVLSKLSGESGMRMVRAILDGERDPERLLSLCATRIQRTKEREMRAALHGIYRDDHLFALRQAVECWDFYQRQLVACEAEIEQLLGEITRDMPPPPTNSNAKPTRHHQPQIEDLHGKLMRLTNGDNPAMITGMSDATVMKVIAETGSDLQNHWTTSKHFVSWLGLSPTHQQSGKMRRVKTLRNRNRAGQLFREAAQSLAGSKYSALGGFYRRIKAKRGPKVAMKAVARKLAVLYYNVMVHGCQYVETGLERYQEQYEQSLQERLSKQARKLGFVLQPLSSRGS